MSDFHIVCIECDTKSTADSESEAQSKVQRHNESMHDGEEIASYDAPIDGVRVVCKECEWLEETESEAEALSRAEEHNMNHHMGQPVAGGLAWDMKRGMEISDFSELTEQQKKNWLDVFASMGNP